MKNTNDITVTLTGCSRGITIDPDTGYAQVDYTKAENYKDVDLEDAVHLTVDRAYDGSMWIMTVMSEKDGIGCIRTYFP